MAEQKIQRHQGIYENFAEAMETYMHNEEIYEKMNDDVETLKGVVRQQKKEIARLDTDLKEAFRLINMLSHPCLGSE
jgi:hypothetical protein